MTPTHIVIHHTATPQSVSFDSINNYHRDVRGFPKSSLGYYVGYHFLILENELRQARKLDEVGAHCLGGWNFKSIGISLAGNFNYDVPNPTQTGLLKALLLELMDEYNIKKENIIFHRDVWSTACPGQNITKEYIYNLVTNRPMNLKENHLYQLVDPNSDGGFGIAVGGKFIVDDLAKLLATFEVRNDGDTRGKTVAIPSEKLWNSIPHYNLKNKKIKD